MTERAEQLRQQILDLTAQFHAEAFPQREFVPGSTACPVSGKVIDAIGGYDTHGKADNLESVVGEGLLPMGLAEGTKVKRAVKKDATLTYADVEIPAGRRIDAVYAEMLNTFGLNKKAAA